MLRCALAACSGSNVHSMRSTPAASARSRCARFRSLGRRPAAHVRQHAEHVRPVRGRAVAHSRASTRRIRRGACAVERADQNAAALGGDQQHRRRHDLAVAAPHGLLHAAPPRGSRRDVREIAQRRSRVTRSDQLGERVDHLDTRVDGGPLVDRRRARAGCRACRPARAPAHVVREAVADHHGLGRPAPHQLERRLEDARVRLHEAVVGRRDRDRDQAVELEVRSETTRGGRCEFEIRPSRTPRACSARSASGTSSYSEK